VTSQLLRMFAQVFSVTGVIVTVRRCNADQSVGTSAPFYCRVTTAGSHSGAVEGSGLLDVTLCR
jgi:hypothetical protein